MNKKISILFLRYMLVPCLFFFFSKKSTRIIMNGLFISMKS